MFSIVSAMNDVATAIHRLHLALPRRCRSPQNSMITLLPLPTVCEKLQRKNSSDRLACTGTSSILILSFSILPTTKSRAHLSEGSSKRTELGQQYSLFEVLVEEFSRRIFPCEATARAMDFSSINVYERPLEAV